MRAFLPGSVEPPPAATAAASCTSAKASSIAVRLLDELLGAGVDHRTVRPVNLTLMWVWSAVKHRGDAPTRLHQPGGWFGRGSSHHCW